MNNMKLAIPQGMTRTVGRSILQAKKNSPHIFFGVGVASVVGSGILACRATLKLEKELDVIHADVEKVKAAPDLTAQERQRLLAVKYGRGVGRLGRLYGPAIVLGVAGVGCLTGAHVQLVRRNAAVTSALGLMSQTFNEYRDRVRDKIGEEEEKDVYHGVSEVTQITDGKKTKLKTVERGVNGHSMYARIFDEQNPYWEHSSELNLMFLRCQQNYWNDRLQRYGHVFLNEVYEALGFDHTKAGAVVGWVTNNTHDPTQGDGYIDFGIYDLNNGRFVNGMEQSVLLDFNVDGTMYDKI